jgi:hypothetical protein
MLLCHAGGIDCIVEITGTIEYADTVAMESFAHSKHVVMMNREVDGIVGPIPKTYADKNLSVDDIDCQCHLAERDDGCGDVVECEEASVELLVSNEQLSETVVPTVADLNHPAARLLRWVAPLGINLFAATDNMRDVAV